MKRSRFSEEQIIGILKDHEAGVPVDEPCRKHDMSPASLSAWKAKFGGMEVSDAKGLKALEAEHGTLKRLPADAMIVTDRLTSYRAAMKVIGSESRQQIKRWLNNRAENSHQPFRRRDGAMARFKDIKTRQKFASIHASIYTHFNHQRHLNRRDIFKQAQAAALAGWLKLAA